MRTEMAAHTGGNILPCVPRKGRPPSLRISKLPPIIQKYVIYKYVAYNIYLFSKHPLELKQPTKNDPNLMALLISTTQYTSVDAFHCI